MTRSLTAGSVLCLLMAVPTAGLVAQFEPYTNGQGFQSSPDPRLRRANREAAVTMIGPEGREFVETYGEEAVAAVFACSRSVGKKLAEFHASGALAKLPRPRDLLLVIAKPRHRDDVALWAIQHAAELMDTDSFDAYLASPLGYALGLKKLQTGAAEARAARLNPNAAGAGPAMSLKALLDDDRLGFACAIGFLVMIVLAVWRKRQSSNR